MRKSRQSFKRAGFETNLPARVFGVPLVLLLAREGRQRSGVPIWAGRMIEYLEARALKLQGLFRVSGHGDEIAAIRLLIESGEEFHLEARCKDPHSIAALLKLFIRELPDSLIPSSMYEAFLEAAAQTEAAARAALLRRLITQLPPENRALLQRLLQLLVKVNEHSAENSMTAQNICICWAPNVLRPDEAGRADVMQGIRDAPLILAAFKELIERYTELFPPMPSLGGSSGNNSGGSSGGSGSNGGVPASSSPSSIASPTPAVSPLAVFMESALPSESGSTRDAAENARRRKENRNAKMQVVIGGVFAEDGTPVHPLTLGRASPPRVSSPPPPAETSLPPLEGIVLPPPPATLPPAPPSPRLLRLELSSLPPPPEPAEDPLPQASLSRALLGKMMDSFSPRSAAAAAAAAAAENEAPPPLPAPPQAPPPVPAPATESGASNVSPLSFLPKINPPSSPVVSPTSSTSGQPSPGWTSVKANRSGASGAPIATSLRRKDEIREMALLAEASRFIEMAGTRSTTQTPAPTAERLFVEVDVFLATSRIGNSSPRKATTDI